MTLRKENVNLYSLSVSKGFYLQRFNFDLFNNPMFCRFMSRDGNTASPIVLQDPHACE